MRQIRRHALAPGLMMLIGLVMFGVFCSAQAKALDRVRIGGHDFYLERAQTPQELAQGLMYRHHLQPRHGMRFVFPSPQLQSFWMKNTKIPLDILFVHDGRVVDVIERAQPCTHDPCSVYQSRQPAEWVIELEGGTAAKYGLQWGDSVQVLPASFKGLKHNTVPKE